MHLPLVKNNQLEPLFWHLKINSKCNPQPKVHHNCHTSLLVECNTVGLSAMWLEIIWKCLDRRRPCCQQQLAYELQKAKCH